MFKRLSNMQEGERETAGGDGGGGRGEGGGVETAGLRREDILWLSTTKRGCCVVHMGRPLVISMEVI